MLKYSFLFLICCLLSCSRVEYVSNTKQIKKEFKEDQLMGTWELQSIRDYGKEVQNTSDFKLRLMYYLEKDKKMRFERYNDNVKPELEITLYGEWELSKGNVLRMIFMNGSKKEIDARYIKYVDNSQLVLTKIPSEETLWVYKKVR